MNGKISATILNNVIGILTITCGSNLPHPLPAQFFAPETLLYPQWEQRTSFTGSGATAVPMLALCCVQVGRCPVDVVAAASSCNLLKSDEKMLKYLEHREVKYLYTSHLKMLLSYQKYPCAAAGRHADMPIPIFPRPCYLVDLTVGDRRSMCLNTLQNCIIPRQSFQLVTRVYSRKKMLVVAASVCA